MTNTNTKLVPVVTSRKLEEAWGRKERCSLFFFLNIYSLRKSIFKEENIFLKTKESILPSCPK